MRFWQKHLFLTEAHKDIFLSLSLPFFHLLAQRLPLLSGRRSVVASVCQSHISCNKAFATHSSLKLAQWMCVRILYIIRSEKSLQPNPCCDGWCTRTYYTCCSNVILGVLILVLMEDALVQKYNGTNESYFEVLILVLMEDALVQYIRDYLSKRELRS